MPGRQKDHSYVVLTHAFLDQGSTATMCDRRLLDRLDIDGETATFSLSTVNHRSSLQQRKKVRLVVSSLDGQESLTLSDVLTIGRLPVSPNPSLSEEELSAWPHLDGLELPPIKHEVLLLIGINNPEVFWVAEERRGAIGEPYAVRTTLGWSLVGPRKANSYDVDQQVHELRVNYITDSNLLLSHQVFFSQPLWQLHQCARYTFGEAKGDSVE